MKEPTFRPQFTISQVKVLYKLLVNYTVKPDDLQEAMVIERLTKSIKQFLVLHDSSARQEIEQKLMEDAWADYDWEANEAKFQAELDRLGVNPDGSRKS